jgi:hypothetical protein
MIDKPLKKEKFREGTGSFTEWNSMPIFQVE